MINLLSSRPANGPALVSDLPVAVESNPTWIKVLKSVAHFFRETIVSIYTWIRDALYSLFGRSVTVEPLLEVPLAPVKVAEEPIVPAPAPAPVKVEIAPAAAEGEPEEVIPQAPSSPSRKVAIAAGVALAAVVAGAAYYVLGPSAGEAIAPVVVDQLPAVVSTAGAAVGAAASHAAKVVSGNVCPAGFMGLAAEASIASSLAPVPVAASNISIAAAAAAAPSVAPTVAEALFGGATFAAVAAAAHQNNSAPQVSVPLPSFAGYQFSLPNGAIPLYSASGLAPQEHRNYSSAPVPNPRQDFLSGFSPALPLNSSQSLMPERLDLSGLCPAPQPYLNGTHSLAPVQKPSLDSQWGFSPAPSLPLNGSRSFLPGQLDLPGFCPAPQKPLLTFNRSHLGFSPLGSRSIKRLTIPPECLPSNGSEQGFCFPNEAPPHSSSSSPLFASALGGFAAGALAAAALPEKKKGRKEARSPSDQKVAPSGRIDSASLPLEFVSDQHLLQMGAQLTRENLRKFLERTREIILGNFRGIDLALFTNQFIEFVERLKNDPNAQLIIEQNGEKIILTKEALGPLLRQFGLPVHSNEVPLLQFEAPPQLPLQEPVPVRRLVFSPPPPQVETVFRTLAPMNNGRSSAASALPLKENPKPIIVFSNGPDESDGESDGWERVGSPLPARSRRGSVGEDEKTGSPLGVLSPPLAPQSAGDSLASSAIFSLADSQVAPPQASLGDRVWNIAGRVRAFFVDPANPIKDLKYHYALQPSIDSDELRGRWDRPILQFLGKSQEELDRFFASGTPEKEINLFAYHAYCSLRSLENSDGYGEIRKQYGHALYHFRQAMSQQAPEDLKETVALLKSIFSKRYTAPAMYSLFDRFIHPAVRESALESGAKFSPTFTLRDIADSIQSANEILESPSAAYQKQGLAMQRDKLLGTVGADFDPTATGNTPWVHSIQTLADGRKITILRHGTPTADPSIWTKGRDWFWGAVGWITKADSGHAQPVVVPEYRAFLDTAKLDGNKQVLYVNHQEFEEEASAMQAEALRSRAIRELEEAHENFNFLALPLDGLLWKSSHLDKTPIVKLREELLDAVMKSEHGFATPKKWDKNPELIRKILEDVHRLYFEGADLATADEKKTFMMLFYSELKDYLKVQLNISYMNSSCKDDKDRGNASKITDTIKMLMLLGREKDPAALEALYLSALAPFIIKNEAIIGKRLDLGLNVIRKIASLNEAQKVAIRNNPTTGFKIVDQQVPAEVMGWAARIKNKAQFEKHLQSMQAANFKKKLNNPKFFTDLSSGFRDGKNWNLKDLRKQIKRDLTSIQLTLNQVPYGVVKNEETPEDVKKRDFDLIIKELGLDGLDFDSPSLPKDQITKKQNKALKFLSFLHQGLAGAVTIDANRMFDCALRGLTVRQSTTVRPFPTQIKASWNQEGSYTVTLDQYLELVDPEGAPIPIKGRVQLVDDKYSMQWELVPSHKNF